jgi:hypothetical protein
LVSRPAGADPALEVLGHRQPRERGVCAEVTRELGRTGRRQVGIAAAGDPEPAERKVAAGVNDVKPFTDLDNPGILNGRAVESFDAGTEYRLRGGALEVIAVAAGCQPEVTLMYSGCDSAAR